MQKRSIFGALAAVAVTATAAYAIVTFDPTTGQGFVGKGDVQTLLNFNNKQMQDAHQLVTFKYVATTEYSFECEWWTGPTHNRQYHIVTETETFDVNASVFSDSRKTGQWTGWNLTGYTSGGPGGGVLTESDVDCGGYGAGKTYVPDTFSAGESTGGLVAVYLGVDYPLQ